jgi:hypothetical protein
MGLKVKYFQCQDWEAYDAEFKIQKYHEYPVNRDNYIHVADFEFETAIGAEQCLWELVYLFGTEDWYTNPKVKVHSMPPLRHIQKTDVFTLVSFGQYSFGIKRNEDMMGMAFPFDYFQDSSFD